MHPNTILHNVTQGSEEWHQSRNGLITASEVNLILTPTLKPANNEKTRAHIYELAAQRISGYTEPSYIGDDMLRGHEDELIARELYSDNYAPVQEGTFLTREIDGVTIGYSPDGFGILDEFGIEIKSRRQKFQIEVITSNEIPKEHILQVQTGLLVTGWEYIDYISYCGGLPMWVIRCYPIREYQDAILAAAKEAEVKIAGVIEEYRKRLDGGKVIETERKEDVKEVYFG